MADRRYRLARRIGRRFGYDVVRSDHYSPIPDELPVDDAARDLPGVDLRLEPSLQLLETELAPYIAEYAEAGSPNGWTPKNRMYPRVDGDILYALVRHLRPQRIVEVGAGWSTRVIRDALARAEQPVDHRLFDPDAEEVARRIGGGDGLQPLLAQDIPRDVFAALEAGDILFIDTTHTVKPGGDVTYLLLEVLPTVKPGVVVHIHDVFTPFDYPSFLPDLGYYWQEQYLIEAFLAFNSDFEVLVANHALGRRHRDRLAAVIPGLGPGVPPGSALWLRRVT